MGCCGQKRMEAVASVAPRPGSTDPSVGAAPVRRTQAIFEYLGATGLTVTGPVTGQRYRFERRGARVAVDLRDRRSVAAVPHLREVA